jgi:hypothetical protein
VCRLVVYAFPRAFIFFFISFPIVRDVLFLQVESAVNSDICIDLRVIFSLTFHYVCQFQSISEIKRYEV